MAEDKSPAAEPEVVSSTGTNDNVMAALATIPIVGLIIYLAMPDASSLVRHYSKQGIALLVVGVVASFVNIIPFLGQLAYLVVSIALFVLWIMMVVKAYNGDESYILPVVGEYFDKNLK